VWLIGMLILLAGVSVAMAGTISDEARRFMARGNAAVEMAKSPGDYVLAISEFKQAAKLAPDWPDIYYSLGTAQSKIEDYTSAIKSFQRYLELAPQSSKTAQVQDEIYKLEYRRDRVNVVALLVGTWTASNGHTFKLTLDGSRMLLTRDGQQGEDILHLKSMGTTYTGQMTDAPSLVFHGMLVGDRMAGEYLQARGKSSGHCDLPERKGLFEGTVNAAAGQMRIVYNRVTFEYKMEFRSLFSAELDCRQTDRKETPGYVLELKRGPQTPSQSDKQN
jgi:hypothetical protein